MLQLVLPERRLIRASKTGFAQLAALPSRSTDVNMSGWSPFSAKVDPL
jgi:hypothetical protein